MDSLSGAAKEEMAVSLVVMALQDGGADINSDNIDTMLKAAGIEAEPYWGMLYGGLVKNTPLTEILATKQGGYVGPE